MKFSLVFALFAACALAAYNFVDESVLMDANDTIENMKRKGATEADCKDLAETSCKEVEKERATDQRIISRQKTGRHCVTKGQGDVTKVTIHWRKVKKTHLEWKIKVKKASNKRVSFSSRLFLSLKPGRCGWIFESREYLEAKAEYDRSVKLELEWRARVAEAWKMVVRMKKIAAELVKKCHCSVKRTYYRLYRTLTKTTRVSLQNKESAKCKMMQCVLNGTPLSDKRCKGTLTKIRKLRLHSDTEKAKCGSGDGGVPKLKDGTRRKPKLMDGTRPKRPHRVRMGRL